MPERLILIGFEHSVYTWIVRLALKEFGFEADYVEANPFADPPDPVLPRYTPLGRVPVLMHGDFRLTETAAILRYLDRLATGPSWQPTTAKALARMDQVIGVGDADVYPILVRQVFSHGYYWPVVLNEPGSQDLLKQGLVRAAPCLSVLEGIAAEGLQLVPGQRSLADFHLAPMMSYALRVPELAALLPGYPALHGWWEQTSEWLALRRTDPLADIPGQE